MKVLLGIGGSDDSMRALETTVERTAEVGDDLTVAIVDNPSGERSREEMETRVTELLDERGVDATVRALDGDPGSALVDLAENEGFDQLVLGGGETSPMGKIQIGNIAEFVLLNSHVTVTLVRRTTRAAEGGGEPRQRPTIQDSDRIQTESTGWLAYRRTYSAALASTSPGSPETGSRGTTMKSASSSSAVSRTTLPGWRSLLVREKP